MRREYGSRLFDLIDAPFSSPVKLDIIAATAEAVMTWEPRVEVTNISLSSFQPGLIAVDLEGRHARLSRHETQTNSYLSEIRNDIKTLLARDK